MFKKLADAAVSAFGGIDIWVNNAARLMVKPFLEMSDEDWHGLLAANLHGYYYGCRAAIRQMVAQGEGGRIINVTSIVDIQPISEMCAYVTAKGGILGMTRELAVSLVLMALRSTPSRRGRQTHLLTKLLTPPL